MKDLDKKLIKDSKKEIVLFSKELNEIIGPVSKNNNSGDLYFEAVYNNEKIILEYISIKSNKNRVKIKCCSSTNLIRTIITEQIDSINLYFKETVIKSFIFKDKDKINLSIKKKNNNYIICYKIKNN